MTDKKALETIAPEVLTQTCGGADGPEPVQPIPNFGGLRYTADWWEAKNNAEAGD